MTFFGRRTFLVRIFFLILSVTAIILKPFKNLNANETEITERRPKPLSRKAEQKKILSAEAREILEQNGTEPPFSSHLLYENREGTYHCAKCDNLLFTSAMKYDSGTGWPSFYDHVRGSIAKKLDFKLVFPRTEYHCRNCGGHQGHVFKDGPSPTFLRWCNNGLALTFKPKNK